MKKALLFISTFFYLNLLMAQTSMPAMTQTLNSSDQYLTNQTLTTTTVWYSFQNTTSSMHGVLNVIQQGLGIKCVELQLFKNIGSTLTLLSADTLLNGNTLEVFAKNVSLNSDLLIKVIGLNLNCNACMPNKPMYNLQVLNLSPSCTGYNQPSCEFVKDGGIEFFNNPCSTIQIIEDVGGPFNAQFAPCFWNLPFGNDPSGIGSADYYTACASTTAGVVGGSTNAYTNFVSGGYSANPHNGDSYVGMYICAFDNAAFPEYREYVVQPLASTLTIGTSYKIGMYIKLSRHSGLATSNIQALLSFSTPTQVGKAHIVPTGQLINVTTTAISDVSGWTYISATFTATGNYSHLTIGNFQNDSSINTISVFPTSSASYFSGHNCAYYFFDDISIVKKTNFDVPPISYTFCLNSPPTTTLSVIPPTPGLTYSWTSSPSLGVLTGTSIVITPTTSINFTVTSSAGGCANTVFTSVNLNSSVIWPAFLTTPSIVCPNNSFTLSTLSSTPPFGSYSYSISPSSLSSPSLPASVAVYTTGINTFTILINNTDGTSICSSTNTISVFVPLNPYPSYTLTPNPVCFGTPVTLIASNLLVTPPGGPGLPGNGININWGDAIIDFTNSNSKNHTYSAPGNYTILATGAGLEGCTNTTPLTFTVTKAKPNFIEGQKNCDELQICFINTSSCTLPYSKWLWTVTGSGGFNQTDTTQQLCQSFPAVGIYTVCLQQDNGFGLSSAFCQTVSVVNTIPITMTNTLTSLCDLPLNDSATFIPNLTTTPTSLPTWIATNSITNAILSIPFTMASNGAITYDLSSFSNYPDPITFCVTVDFNGCISKQCETVYPCCNNEPTVIAYKNATFNTNTVLSGPTKYHFSGTITINAPVFFFQTEITLDPNTKIIVQNGSLDIYNSYLHGCSAMWDGIYLYQNSEIRIKQINTIEDAKRAIIDTLGANHISIENCWFNKNYESIVLKKANTTQYLELNICIFTCSSLPPVFTSAGPASWITSMTPASIGLFSPTNLLPPYNLEKSYSGITLYETKSANTTLPKIEITSNLFDNLRFGIVATRSKFHAKLNRFQNIMAGKGLHAAIYTYGTPLKLIFNNPSIDATIGGTPTDGNSFENCTHGVYSLYKGNLSITNNTLTAISKKGVFVNQNNTNVTIDQNKFNQCFVGVHLHDNGAIKADVTNNQFVNTSPVGTYNTNFSIITSEVVAPTAASIGRYYNIFNNHIDGYYNGIYTANTYSTQIADNDIYIRPDNTIFNFQFGIRLEGTNKTTIYNNTIDKAYPDNYGWWQFGIFLDGNTVPAIKCNSINNFYASVKFQMLNYSAPGNGLTFNTFSNYNHAIWLDHNAEIGDQYFTYLGTNNASMNQWLTPPPSFGSQTFVSNNSNQTIASGMPGASKIFTSASGTYLLNNLFALTNSGNALLRGVGYSPLFIPCPASIPTPLMFQSNNIAVNNLSYGINTTNLEHVSNCMLVKNLKTAGINLNSPSNAIYKNFINATYTTSVGQFYRVDSLINLAASTGSLSTINQAKLLNTSISTPNLLEQNQKWLNATYLDMQTTEPDSTTLLMLEQLAIKCPQYDGEAVYQARSLLMYYFGKSYNSICDIQNIQPSFSRVANIAQVHTEQTNVSASVYPNPTHKDITITYTKGDANEAAVFEVYNMLGELVLNQTLTENKTTLSLSDLSNGIYIYFIKQDGITLQTNKLVLSK